MAIELNPNPKRIQHVRARGSDGTMRHTIVHSAYDCPGGDCPHCAEGKRGDHGIAAEYWYFTVGTGDAALTIGVSTPVFAPTVSPAPADGFRSDLLRLCLAWRNDVEAIAKQSTPVDCAFLDACHPAGTWGLLAQTFVDEHFVEADGIEQRGPFWNALHARLIELAEPLQKFKLVKQCECCAGSGVLEPKAGD